MVILTHRLHKTKEAMARFVTAGIALIHVDCDTQLYLMSSTYKNRFIRKIYLAINIRERLL